MTNAEGFNLQEINNLKILKELAEALNEANDVSSAMEAILPRLSQVLGLSTAWAFRYDPSRRSFVEVGASGLPPALAQDNAAQLKSGWCECQSQFVEGKLHSAVNLVRCSRLRDATGDKEGLVYHASIPLRSKGKPLGILNVAASGRAIFTQEALALLTAIGHQVAVAIDRAGLLASERKRSVELKALSEITAELLRFVDNDKMLQFAVDRLVETLGYDACGILDDNRGQHSDQVAALVAAAHLDVPLAKQEYSYMEDDPPPVLPISQQVILADARSALDRPIPQSPYRLRIESRTANAFTDEDGDLLASFAWHITAALENAKLYRQSMNAAKWQERRRLAADLHDTVSQRLFSALLLARSASLSQSQSEDTRQTEQSLNRIQTLISQSQQEMRELIQALRPVGQHDFVAAVRERIMPLQPQTGIRFEVTADEDIPRISDFAQQTLLNVVNEAVQNVMRHSHCRNAMIHIGADEDSLTVRITDDGVGFNTATIKHGLGTSTMRERVEQLQGILSLSSTPGEGSKVDMEIPLSMCRRTEKEDRK